MQEIGKYQDGTVAFLLAALERLIRSKPPEAGAFDRPCPADLAGLLAAQGMEAVFHACLPAAGLAADWLPLADRCAHAYRYNLLCGLDGLRQGSELIRHLAEGGVDTVAWRGPFAGVDWYGDVAARGFADLDLLIRAADRDRAWELARTAGYRPCQALPRFIFDRHHLHWRLARAGAESVVELHWALDHPYKPYRINCEAVFRDAVGRRHASFAWHRPSTAHAWLMACVHLQKHMRLAPDAAGQDDFKAQALRRQGLRYWLDLAMLAARHRVDLEAAEVPALAGRWAVEDCLAAATGGLARLWPGLLPASLCPAMTPHSPAAAEPASRSRRWLDLLAARIGFRPVCLQDFATYQLGARRGWWLGLRLGADAVFCLAWLAVRRLAVTKGKHHASG